ncbi:MAG TPA: TVP38/TMEM64 family protein [Firmicutes bacterium]|nr:TVP38/TMEM64 family protein [Bacillota bacterium]HBS93973.1 TVP38/TMEM64 family protein [Bacillota bacterium]
MVEIEGKQKLKIILNIIALMLLIGAIVYLSIRYTPQAAELFARRDELKEAVENEGLYAIAAFICVQVFQVVVAAVPGELVQLAGGYLFGTFWGAVFLVSGIIIGSLVAFFAARLLGFRLVKTFVSAPKLAKLLRLVSGTKSELVIFTLFLLPGLPKDVLTYIAGLTPVNPWRFLALAILGRLPALVVSCYIGASLEQENLWAVVIVSALSAVLILGGWLYKDWILEKVRMLKSEA